MNSIFPLNTCFLRIRKKVGGGGLLLLERVKVLEEVIVKRYRCERVLRDL